MLDAELRADGRVVRRASWARSTTGCRAACRSGSWTRSRELLDAVGGYLDAGYLRIKLKIEPGWDVAPVRAVRERFGDDVAAAGRRQYRLHAGRRRRSWPGSTRSTCC